MVNGYQRKLQEWESSLRGNCLPLRPRNISYHRRRQVQVQPEAHLQHNIRVIPRKLEN